MSSLAASYLGAVHPVGDSLAVFREWILYGVAGVGVLALLVRAWGVGALSLSLAVAAGIHLASFNRLYTPAPVLRPDLVVYSKNLYAENADWEDLAQDIAGSGADVVLLQEVTQTAADALTRLLPDHPHVHVCQFSDRRGIALASRWPLSQQGCTDQRSLAYGVVDAPGGPVWVASIHQVWPFPHNQAGLLPDILARISTAPPRRVIAGDFNMVPWGHSVAAIMEAGDARRISPVLPTIELRGVGLPIDHVLTDGQGLATRAPKFGSDHYGLVGRIVWE